MKQYRIEDDLIKKTRPKWKSKRYRRLQDVAYSMGLTAARKCEQCGKMLLNPQSIIIHQGGNCQSKMK